MDVIICKDYQYVCLLAPLHQFAGSMNINLHPLNIFLCWLAWCLTFVSVVTKANCRRERVWVPGSGVFSQQTPVCDTHGFYSMWLLAPGMHSGQQCSTSFHGTTLIFSLARHIFRNGFLQSRGQISSRFSWHHTTVTSLPFCEPGSCSLQQGHFSAWKWSPLPGILYLSPGNISSFLNLLTLYFFRMDVLYFLVTNF